LAAPISDLALLEELERSAFEFFWNEACPGNGLIRDRVHAEGGGSRGKASMGATGFGLTALAIGYERQYRARPEIERRVAETLDFLLHRAPHEHGFLYHFADEASGGRYKQSEVSPIDTAILL